METSQTLSKWLIRVYVLAILVIVVGNILEGAVFTIIITLLGILIITQTFLLPKRKTEPSKESEETKHH
ncbi:MAG: hypothetical protein WD335_03365 [Candidatus Paceibacterota bacterium]